MRHKSSLNIPMLFAVPFHWCQVLSMHHIFLTSALVGGEWSASCTGHFTPEERVPSTNLIGGRLGPRDGLVDMEKKKFLILPGLELWPLSCSTCRQLLYQLSYPRYIFTSITLNIYNILSRQIVFKFVAFKRQIQHILVSQHSSDGCI
jgi:hypothetical protein